jgi:exoribonuclease-2
MGVSGTAGRGILTGRLRIPCPCTRWPSSKAGAGLTEDGRAFEYPADRLLWTARALRAEGVSKREIAAALKVLRAGAGPAPDWGALAAGAPKGVPLDPQDLAGGGTDLAADRRALALACRAHEGAPFLRIEKGRLVAASEEEVRAERERAAAARRAEEAEGALAAALAAKVPGPVPADAAPALEVLLEWALGPPETPPPGIAKRLGIGDVYEAIERIDAAGWLPADAIPSLSRRGIPREFSRKVRAAAAAAVEAPDPAAGAREDLRAVPAYAVDDPETSEVDDALSLLRGPGGEPRLLVHIADAASALPPESPLDREARRRAVTVYLPETKVPMIPPDLVAARLSLEAGEDRPALSMEIRVRPDGTPEAVRAFRSLVRIGRRLDYDETREPAGLPAGIRPLLDLARAMRAARAAAGARILEVPAAHLRVRDGTPVLLLRGIGGAGDVLIGEAMVAHNRLAADLLRGARAPALWRTQEPPRGDHPPRDDPLFAVRARRLFSPVRVALEPGRHEGLAVDAYLQATSPLRRYSDLVHQRQLAAVAAGEAPPHGAQEVAELAGELFRQERLVRQAEAEREDHWMAVLLEARRGEVFEGFVSRAPLRGRGQAWIPSLLSDLPFLWPKERPDAPAEGAPIRLRPGRLARHRGRAELAPA